MKICMLASDHAPFDDRLFYKESRSLLDEGYNVTIISAVKNEDRDLRNYPNLNIEYVQTRIKSKVVYWTIVLFKMFLKSIRVNADVYHCHEPETFLVAILLKMVTRKKIVYDVYEYYPDVVALSSGFRKYFLKFMLNFFEPIFCKYADGIITADTEIAKRYCEFNKNVCTLFNYPCIDLFEFQSNPISHDHKMDGSKKIIYVGGMSEERGILQLIRSTHKILKIYPSVKLLLVGSFSKLDFEMECKEYVKSHNLDRNVEFVGSVPHIMIPQYIYSADIGAVLLQPIPKFYKNIPTKQFEYMACGKPVVGSDLPPITHYIRDSNCGIIVDSTDVDNIADAILYSIRHPADAKQMGENGRQVILKKYNWNAEGYKLLSFYEDLLRR
jgi:glycosyltransferase involved in cell wall biosynthesis